MKRRGKTLFRKLASAALFSGITMSFFAVALSAGVVSAQEAPAAQEEAVVDMARGEQLFQLCTQCHGTDGGGNSAALAPAIAGLPDWYVEGQLKKFKTGVRGLHPDDTGGMRMYPMSLWVKDGTDQKSVAAYVASMPPPPVVNELPEVGDATAGAGYYAVCSACHGPTGGGNQGMGAPPLTGLNDWYLQTSISKYKAGVRGSGRGDALGAAMIGMVGTLPNEQAILDVIAHIQALGK